MGGVLPIKSSMRELCIFVFFWYPVKYKLDGNIVILANTVPIHHAFYMSNIHYCN